MSRPDDKLAYSAQEAAEIVGLNVATIRKAYLDPDSGLVAVRLGAKVLITRDALEAWLAALPTAR